jgi:hypothetical protein
LEIVQWIIGTGYNLDFNVIAGSAAMGGHIHILEWLKHAGNVFTSDVFQFSVHDAEIETLNWLFKEGVPFDARTFTKAINSHNLEAMNWLRDHGCPWDLTTYAQPERVPGLAQWIAENGIVSI